MPFELNDLRSRRLVICVSSKPDMLAVRDPMWITRSKVKVVAS